MVNVNVTTQASSTPTTALLPDTLLPVQASSTQYTYASPSGTVNNVVSGVPRFIGSARLTVTLPAGNATWTGLQAGTDNQHLILWNYDVANTLTLAVQNTGSLAINRFQGSSGGYALMPGNPILMVYYAGNVNAWVIVP